jgi:hypothetical protein
MSVVVDGRARRWKLWPQSLCAIISTSITALMPYSIFYDNWRSTAPPMSVSSAARLRAVAAASVERRHPVLAGAEGGMGNTRIQIQ